jgi:hypothetical protein
VTPGSPVAVRLLEVRWSVLPSFTAQTVYSQSRKTVDRFARPSPIEPIPTTGHFYPMTRADHRPPDIRRRLLKWGGAFLVGLALYTLIGTLVAPRIAEHLIIRICEDRLGRTPAIESIRMNPFTLSIGIDGFALPDRAGTEILTFDRLEANAQISSLVHRTAVLKIFRIDGPTLVLRRFEDEAINLLELWADLERLSPPPPEGFELPPAVLERIEIAAGSIIIEDRASPETNEWRWTPIDAELHDISTLPDHRGDNEVTVALAEGGLLTASGVVTIEPLDARGSVHLEGAAITEPWRAVAHRFGVRLRDGRLGADLTYRIHDEEDGFGLLIDSGTGQLEDLVLEDASDGTEILSLDSLRFEGLGAHWPEQRVEVESVVVDGADARAWIDADGSPSWDRWVPQAVREQIRELFREHLNPAVDLGRFEISQANASFEDRRFPEPVRLETSSVDLNLSDISYRPPRQTGGGDGSRAPDQGRSAAAAALGGATQFELVADLPEGGHARATGRLDPFAPFANTVLELDARDVPLRVLSPVMLEWFGFPLERGVSEIHSNIQIEAGELASTHRLDVDGLTLGRRVEGRGRIRLPMRLGVALLEGPDGHIGLDLPVEGDLDNPKFLLASAVRGAIVSLVKDLVTAPFRLLAKIGGGSDEDDLETVEFRPGESSLDPAVRADLEIVSGALRKRPALKLEITGAADPETDRDALATAALTEALDGRAPVDAPIEALERLYSDIGSMVETVETVRTRFEGDNERYREALLDALMREAEVGDAAIEALAASRAGTIREFLVAAGGIAEARLTVLPTAEIRPAEGDRIRCRLGVVAPSPEE